MADTGHGRGSIPFTPTPARGVGTTERLSTHRADDNRFGDNEFERSLINRGIEPYRGNDKARGRRRRRS